MSLMRFSTPRKEKEVELKVQRMNSSPEQSNRTRQTSPSANTYPHYRRAGVNKIMSLLHPEEEEAWIYLMIPYYTRLKIKDISQISYRQSTAVMNASLIINIDVTGLTPEILKKIKSRLTLQINHCEQVKIKDSSDIEIVQSKEVIYDRKRPIKEMRQLKITIRKQFQVLVEKKYSHIFYSPYEELAIIATFTLNNIVWENDKKKFKVSFNSMRLCFDQLINDFKSPSTSQHMEKLRYFLREIQYEDNHIKDISVQFKSIDRIVEQRLETFQNLFLKDKHSLSLQLYLKEMRLEIDKATCGDYQFSTLRLGVQDTNIKQHNQHQYTCLGKRRNPKDQSFSKQLQIQKKQELKLFRKKGYDGESFPKKYKPFKEYHQYTHFCVTLYKNPFPEILTILLPNLFLGIISFYIFYLKHDLIERTNIIATLLLGFIQLIPTIKGQLSDSSKVTLLECLTCISTLLCLASFYESFTREDELVIGPQLQNERFTFSQLYGYNFWFTLSLIVNMCLLFTVFASIGYFFYHEYNHLLHPSYYKKRSSKFAFLRRLSLLKGYWPKWLHFNWLKAKGKSPASDETQLRKYSDYVILKDFFKIPSHFEHRFSKFWSNDGLQMHLDKEFKDKTERYEEFEESELRANLLRAS